MPENILQALGYHAYSALMLGFLLLSGYVAVRLPLIKSVFLPGSLVAGLILLLFSPQIAGVIAPGAQIPAHYYDDWKVLPALLINVVFACLFLARPLLPFKRIWSLAGPQVAFGQTLAWGQYVIGGLLAMLILVPLLGMPAISAALIEISFEGGHGTAAGLAPVFDQLGFPQGQEMAIGLATTSLIVALISGVILVNWAKRKHHIREIHHETAQRLAYHRRILNDLRKDGVRVRDHITSGRIFGHLALVALAILIGWVLHQGLMLLESTTWAAGNPAVAIFKYVPLFPLCMIGGIIAHSIWHQLGFTVSRPLIELISALALSVLITTAVGTMALGYIGAHWEAFVLLAVTGVAWLLFAFRFLAPRMFNQHWFQRGIVDMGQSMGMTATGLLFLHMVDPKDKTNSMESFGYKQLLFEPFFGGGFITALSMPLIVALGLPIFTAVAAFAFGAWLLLGLRYFGRMRVVDRKTTRRVARRASVKP